MGTVVPAAGEHSFGSEQDAFVGRFEMAGERLAPRPVCHRNHTTDRGFRTTGEIEYGGGAIRQTIAVVALEEGETVVLIDLTDAEGDAELRGNEGLGIYLMNDFVNGNHVSAVWQGGRARIRGVGGKAREIDTGSPWIRLQGCLGAETDGITFIYQSAAARNTPAKWKSVLQDRVFLRPEAESARLRDYCVVVRMGRSGARRTGKGVSRLAVDGERVRAYRFETRSGAATVVANLSHEDRKAGIDGRVVDLPAMDTLVIP